MSLIERVLRKENRSTGTCVNSGFSVELGSRNPRLHMEEVLIALSSSSESNPLADLALRQLPNLRGSQVHTSRMLSAADEKTFQKLGVMLTSEAK